MMNQHYDSEIEDTLIDLEDDLDVEAFLRSVERRDRKMHGLGARRKFERRLERRELSRDLEEYFDY